jgi:hypothetical protein
VSSFPISYHVSLLHPTYLPTQVSDARLVTTNPSSHQEKTKKSALCLSKPLSFTTAPYIHSSSSCTNTNYPSVHWLWTSRPFSLCITLSFPQHIDICVIHRSLLSSPTAGNLCSEVRLDRTPFDRRNPQQLLPFDQNLARTSHYPFSSFLTVTCIHLPWIIKVYASNGLYVTFSTPSIETSVPISPAMNSICSQSKKISEELLGHTRSVIGDFAIL